MDESKFQGFSLNRTLGANSAKMSMTVFCPRCEHALVIVRAGDECALQCRACPYRFALKAKHNVSTCTTRVTLLPDRFDRNSTLARPVLRCRTLANTISHRRCAGRRGGVGQRRPDRCDVHRLPKQSRVLYADSDTLGCALAVFFPFFMYYLLTQDALFLFDILWPFFLLFTRLLCLRVFVLLLCLLSVAVLVCLYNQNLVQNMISADEPMTMFLKCTKCGHRWREG